MSPSASKLRTDDVAALRSCTIRHLIRRRTGHTTASRLALRQTSESIKCQACTRVVLYVFILVRLRRLPGYHMPINRCASGFSARYAGLQWRWTLFAANNKRIADSGEGYHNKNDCLHAIGLVKVSSQAPFREQ